MALQDLLDPQVQEVPLLTSKPSRHLRHTQLVQVQSLLFWTASPQAEAVAAVAQPLPTPVLVATAELVAHGTESLLLHQSSLEHKP